MVVEQHKCISCYGFRRPSCLDERLQVQSPTIRMRLDGGLRLGRLARGLLEPQNHLLVHFSTKPPPDRLDPSPPFAYYAILELPKGANQSEVTHRNAKS